METKEKNFEQNIESWLLTEGGYVKGNMWTYDKKRAIDMPVLIQFIEATCAPSNGNATRISMARQRNG